MCLKIMRGKATCDHLLALCHDVVHSSSRGSQSIFIHSISTKAVESNHRINRKCPMDGCRMYVDRRVSSHLIVRIEITEAVVLVCSGEVLCHDLGAFFFGCHLGVAYALLVGSIPIPLSGFCTLGSGELSLASCGETVFVLRSMLLPIGT